MKKRDNRRAQIKKAIRGTAEKPRLVIFRSNRFLYAQLINDTKGVTLAQVNKAVDPVVVGTGIAENALKLKIKKVVFDRAGYRYHGKVKKIAEAAREKGLIF